MWISVLADQADISRALSLEKDPRSGRTNSLLPPLVSSLSFPSLFPVFHLHHQQHTPSIIIIIIHPPPLLSFVRLRYQRVCLRFWGDFWAPFLEI